MRERMEVRKMEEQPQEEMLHNMEEAPSSQENSRLSPEQEQTLSEIKDYQQGLRRIFAEKQAELAAGVDDERGEVLRDEIAELERTISEWDEFIDDVSPEAEQPESESVKRERLVDLLREAAQKYQENHEKGKVGIGFLTDSGDTWFIKARVAEVTDETVIFAEGDTFPLQYVEEVELLDAPDA